MAQIDLFDEAVKSENVPPEVVAAVTEALSQFRAQHDLDPADWQIRIFPSKDPLRMKLFIGGRPNPTIRTLYEIDIRGDIREQALSRLETHAHQGEPSTR